eukprot:UN04159
MCMGKLNKAKKAINIYENVPLQYRTNQLYSAILKACEKDVKICDSLWNTYIGLCETKKIDYDNNVCNAYLMALGRSGYWKKVLHIFDDEP